MNPQVQQKLGLSEDGKLETADNKHVLFEDNPYATKRYKTPCISVSSSKNKGGICITEQFILHSQIESFIDWLLFEGFVDNRETYFLKKKLVK